MDKTYARFVVTVSASVEDINAMSESVERLTQALVEDIDDKCTAYTGSSIRVKFKELKEYDWDQSAEQSVHPTNGGLALRACVSAHCGWVGKESACLTWKHAGDERMCPHCHDNTESIPLSAISG